MNRQYEQDTYSQGSSVAWISRLIAVGVLAPVLMAVGSAPVLAGDGVVALQTADPACPDDSGNIYVDCGNGTVTDNRTGLVWLKHANCLGALEPGDGAVSWYVAVEFVAGLADLPPLLVGAQNDCYLSDGSSPGEWRLPSLAEWQTMIADALGDEGDPDCTASPPTITNDSGLGCWISGPSSFEAVVADIYWSSGTPATNLGNAWSQSLTGGPVGSTGKDSVPRYVWPVRGGQ